MKAFKQRLRRRKRFAIMDTIQFDRWTEELGKEKFRELLAEYIATERPKFPLKQISYEDMRKNIIDLSKFDTSKICTLKNRLKKKVFEKYDDYEYGFDKYGLGLIDALTHLIYHLIIFINI